MSVYPLCVGIWSISHLPDGVDEGLLVVAGRGPVHADGGEAECVLEAVELALHILQVLLPLLVGLVGVLAQPLLLEERTICLWYEIG